MAQESNPAIFNLIQPPIPSEAEAFDGLEEIFELVAAGLYSLASMLLGEGEESARLVEEAIANAEVSVCQDPQVARRSSRQSLSAAALDLLAQRSPGCLAAPLGLATATICIEDDDLAAVGISAEELESMIGGPERDRMRQWLASLPIAMRAVFVLRAVAGFTAAETAELLKLHGGPQAAAWTPEAAREVFRQGLCSLASQLLRNRD
jgi:DNA-directed RNA polymerase specialized sigma24 family protein